MTELENESAYITAKRAASRYGFNPRTKSGRNANHTMFLKRMVEHHPNFPAARWIAGRKVFKLDELEAFERSLPRATNSAAA